MTVSRRNFLKQSTAIAAGFAGLHAFLGPVGCRMAPTIGYGPLVTDPQGILDLPEDFSYSIFSRRGERMSDGFVVPGAHDGMAAFAGPGGRIILVRNHEVNLDSDAEFGPFGAENAMLSALPTSKIYDAGAAGSPCLGGTTTVVYDPRAQRVVSQHLSLVGTLRNCAGGPTPWGSWISCEETTIRAGELASRDHGFNFEVPASAEPVLADPIPLTAMGRFNHEAVAVHPDSGIVYETEDRSDGLIYRFVPDEPGRLAAGGRLQALAVRERPGLDTRNWEEPLVIPGDTLDVEWVDLDNVESPEDDLRIRGFDAGAARFARGEGMWYGRDAIFIACTNGGSQEAGQIWRYAPSPAEGTPDEAGRPGTLELFIEPDDSRLLENCDNVTVAPWGDLILCEDGSEEQFLVGVTPQGELYRFGRNVISSSEFAGATFAPDGSTLFVNMQGDGLTLAITGPWKSSA